MENYFTFEELRNITSKVRENKKNEYIEKIKIGSQDAIKHITQNCYEKMIEASKKGHDKAYLYSFQWTNEKDSVCDKNGIKTLFEGNIRLLDLLMKDKVNFINDLNKFFNKDCENKYHCGFFKSKEEWIIYVSWSNLEEKDKKKYSNKKIIKNVKKI